MEKDSLELNIHLKENDRKQIAEILQDLLASSYALYLKTQNFHWNVTGPSFPSYHVMFQNQYEELAETIDEIAERIRALGYFPEGSFESFSKRSLIEDEKKVISPTKMIQILLQDHECLIRFLRESLPTVEKFLDGATADFINKRLSAHEKIAWMLRSILET